LQIAIRELRSLFPDPKVVITDPHALKTYGSSENSYHPESPHAVIVGQLQSSAIQLLSGFQVRPHSTEDVVQIVNVARKYRVPITAYSGATSLEGHFSGVIMVPP